MIADRVEQLCQQAQRAIAQRDWDQAKQSYLMALGQRSNSPDIHYGLATVYFQLRELTSASHHFREVTRLDPLRASAYINLGAVLNLLGEYEEAIKALRRGLQLDGTRVEGYYNLGLVYRRKNQFDLAIEAYKEALRLNPRMADAHLNLANMYYDRLQYEPALRHYQEALKLRPGWEKAQEGVERTQQQLTPSRPGTAASASASEREEGAKVPTAVPSERVVDPVYDGVFLSQLHQLSAVAVQTGQLLHDVVLQEVEPSIKQLSTVLMNARGSRHELEVCLERYEAALSRMKTAHQALKTQMERLADQGKRFPT
ncbi:MAG: tetratricopeptide repeat protein [Gemmataceae bacterium]